MEKFIPFEKLSKRKQRELNRRKRGSWHGVDPVTRRSPNPKAYDRKKAPRWQDEPWGVFCLPAGRKKGLKTVNITDYDSVGRGKADILHCARKILQKGIAKKRKKGYYIRVNQYKDRLD